MLFLPGPSISDLLLPVLRRSLFGHPRTRPSFALFLFTLFLGALLARAGEPNGLRHYRLPAGPAERTLKLFSQQSGRGVIFATDAVRDVVTPAIEGRLTAREALDRMLSGSPLVVEIEATTGAWGIRRKHDASSEEKKASGPVVVEPRSHRPENRNSSGPADETILLTPFEITASSDMGYEATETLAGSRLNTQLRDVATQVNVMTPEFLQDLAITNLDDAMSYSLNTENRFETIDVDSNNFGSSESIAVVGSGQGGRTRGLSAPNNSHDFFDTFIRMDSYNTERFTFANGPNSILFGNSSPAGTIDTTFKRAQPNRRLFEVSNRISSTDSQRFTLDVNQPLVRNQLALRVAALKDKDKSWRKPAFRDQDRLYTTLTYAPLKWLTVRAYSEHGRFEQQAAKNTLVQDHVTPWIRAGKPLYDNALGKPLLSATTNPAIPPSLRRPTTTVRAIISYNTDGFLGYPITNQNSMALTSGYVDFTPAPDNFERSITDPTVYPFDRSFNGNASQAKFTSWIRGASIEANPWKKLFIELATNEERIRNRGVEFMDARVHELNGDPNLYLNDRVTPNPMAGRFYVEDAIGGVNNAAAKNHGEKKQSRLSLSYEIDCARLPGWRQWLGTHRFAFLADRLESTQVSETSLFTISPFSVVPTPGVPYSFVTTNGNSQQIGFRYYIDPAKDDWTIKLPFDVNRDGVITQPGWVDANGKQVYLASFDPSGHVAAPSIARNRVDSTALVVNSAFFDRRLLFSYARRRDAVDIQSELNKPGNWDFDALLDSIRWETVKRHEPTNTVKSVVLHPLSWLSLAYAETTSQQVRTEVVRHLDGTVAELGAGVGRDYGFTVRLKHWLSLRLNRYENSGVGNVSSFRSDTPTASEGALGPSLKRTVAALERGVQVLSPRFDPAHPELVDPALLSPRFSAYQRDLALYTDPTATLGNVLNNRYEVISDTVAKGYELTLTSNPTPHWRIALSGAKNMAIESNIGGQFWDFIQERLPIWGAASNLDHYIPSSTGGVSNNYRTYREVLAVAAQNWYYIKQSEGRLNNNLRKYRLTATTRYAFEDGMLKGLFVGGNYVWRSAAAVGYPYITITDNPFLIPGVASSTVSMPDISRPYRGGAITTFDLFFGYGRRLLGDKVRWRAQLNIRNAFNRDNLIVQKTLSTGEGAIFTPQEPRTFILTNTFSF